MKWRACKIVNILPWNGFKGVDDYRNALDSGAFEPNDRFAWHDSSSYYHTALGEALGGVYPAEYFHNAKLDVQVVELLIERGVSVNAPCYRDDREDVTPLYLVLRRINYGQMEWIRPLKLLVKRGARVRPSSILYTNINYAHYELAVCRIYCGAAIVAFIGARRFNRSAPLACLPRDIVVLIARYMWSDRTDDEWFK